MCHHCHLWKSVIFHFSVFSTARESDFCSPRHSRPHILGPINEVIHWLPLCLSKPCLGTWNTKYHEWAWNLLEEGVKMCVSFAVVLPTTALKDTGKSIILSIVASENSWLCFSSLIPYSFSQVCSKPSSSSLLCLRIQNPLEISSCFYMALLKWSHLWAKTVFQKI